LAVEDLAPAVVRRFLTHVEQVRGCGGATRNLRLGALHSLAKFIGGRSPEHLAWAIELRAIPCKKTVPLAIGYLEKPELDAVLQAPNRQTAQGRRDYAVLLFLYNTGARADEAARLMIGDLTGGRTPAVRLVGKGNKTRQCPLWPRTAALLRDLAGERAASERVFRNRRGQPLTRFGLYQLVRRAVRTATRQLPALGRKRISPHTMRHTCGAHLLRAGVDLNTIRAWLGHVSLDTTQVYAEVDLEMKAKALAHCELPEGASVKRWRKEPGLMGFLRAL
jgi:integrase